MENKSKRLAKNTFMLTCKMLFLLIINLYTSRVLLDALGVSDYGIYNAVGGIVTMFSVISGSITAAITRYITYELGKGENENGRLSKVFSTAVIIQLFLAGIVLTLLETVGVWFLNNHMNIPVDRVRAANWVFQFSIITFVINLISVPYNAAIIAHEKMNAFAYIGIYEGIMKLFIAFGIMVSPIDKLIFYAISLCFLSVSVRLIYGIYCNHNFNECTLVKTFDVTLIKEMFGFAGWNFIGAAAGLLRDQGGNILINIFCGPVANAARGLAYQVNNAVQSFLSSFTTAMHPQITKSYSSGDDRYFMSLIYKGSKISYYILFILSLPIILNTEYIVQLWLGQVPEHTINFIRLVLILSMSEAISTPLVTAMLATGNIKKYQIIVGGLNMMNLPISYLFLRQGSSPEVVFIIAIIISQICLYARIYLLRDMINLETGEYIRQVYLRIIIVTIISSLLSFITYVYAPEGFTGLLIVSIASVLIACFGIYFLGLTRTERDEIVMIVIKIKQKFLKYYKN